MECANGKMGTKGDGCLNQNSFRVRCPKDNLPCNDLAKNGKEFSCHKDCSTHGGVKECFGDGIMKYF